MATRRIALISTGGTIEKTYDELSGVLANQLSVLDVMLGSLELRGVEVFRVQLMNKDSLEMTAGDHTLIANTSQQLSCAYDGVVVVHGTDRLAESGNRIVEVGTERALEAPVILTGAMRPYLLRTTDALQNLTEAMLAVQLVPNGVYVAMHNKVLKFPGVKKDVENGTFIKAD